MSQRSLGLKFLAAALFTAVPAIAGSIVIPCSYAGEAVVASANVLGLRVALSDTGALPSTGGSLSAQLLNANLPGLLNLQLLDANTAGASGKASSQASVANVSVSAAGVYITASVISSNANAQGCANAASVSGSSTIANLTVNGLAVTVTGAPNQVVPLLVGSLIINEQVSSVSSSNTGNSADMLVNALHLKVLSLADVVISSSHAGVCGVAGCRP